MSSESGIDPTRRIEIELTSNAVLEASASCVERCGIVGHAQEMAVVATAMCAGGMAVATWERSNPTAEITTEGDEPVPQIIMSCKGPRKKHWVFGELVCRGNVKVDTALRLYQ